MNEMPDDIRAAAVSVYSRYLKDIGSLSLVDLLAEALMAERERCAKIADGYNIHDDDDILEPEYATGRNVTAQFVAAAIRRGTP